MKSKISFAVIIFIIMASHLTTAQESDYPLQSLIKRAIEFSPKVKMLQSKLEAAKAEIEIGTNLPDPVLTMGIANLPTNSFSFTQEPMTGKFVGISQSIPFPGKLGAATQVKAVDSLIVLNEISEEKNQIRKQVSDFYYNLMFYREKLRLAKYSLSLLKGIESVVQSKYKVGLSPLQNVINVAVQIDRVKEKIEILQAKESSVLIQLNELIFQNIDNEIPTPQISKLPSVTFSTEKLISYAEKFRPSLQSLLFLQKKADLLKKDAEFSFYPNFKVGVQYTQRDFSSATGKDYKDLFSVVVGVTIPINYGGNKTSKVVKAEKLKSLYYEQYQSSLLILRQYFGKIISKTKELKNREKLYVGSLIPNADKQLKAATFDYEVGKIDFVNVIKAEEQLIKVNTDLAKIRTDYLKEMSRLIYLSGADNNMNLIKLNDNGESK